MVLPQGHALDTTSSKAVPLSPGDEGGGGGGGGGTTGGASHLNHRLQTSFLNVDKDDHSICANLTRMIANVVASIFTPKQVLAILRVLKALSLSFIFLTILADAMYILFVEIISTPEVKQMAGGYRDIVIRVYGLILSGIALAIELDFAKVVKKFSGLKPFLARSLLYFFIAIITGSHPIYDKAELAAEVEAQQYAYAGDDANYYSNNYENYNGDDQAANGDDDAAQNYDDAVQDDQYQYSSSSESNSSNLYEQVAEIPNSAVGFQRVTSFVLAICAFAYFICGLLCFDRFTARAFLSTTDPRITTAIPNSKDYGPAPDDEEQDYHRHMDDPVQPGRGRGKGRSVSRERSSSRGDR